MAATRHNAFQALDEAKFGRSHVRAVLVSGVGFFTDAYDIFIIGLVVPMIGFVYFQDNGGKVPTFPGSSIDYDGLIKGVSIWGTLLGQLVFGILGDKLGRKKVYGVELAIMIVSTIACCFASNTARGMGVLAMLGFWRFWLGFGIGGDYPVSAIITSEFATVKRRGQMMAMVFSMQGIGILFGALFSFIVLSCFKSAINDPTDPQGYLYFDYVWRICLGLAVIPNLAAIYFRLTIPETPRYTAAINGDAEKAVRDSERFVSGSADTGMHTTTTIPVVPARKGNSFADFRAFFGKRENAKLLFATSLCWFCLDVAFYGLSLNNSVVISNIGFKTDKHSSPYDVIHAQVVGNVIIAFCGTVPGYYFSVAFIEKMGRKKIQLMGFAMCTIIYIVLASAYNKILETSTALFIFLYSLGMFFKNFGANMTTFIYPGEIFPTRFRSTAHGISAACGKAGAILAAHGFAKWKADLGLDGTLGVLAGFMFIGFCTTFLLPETAGRSLEEINNEGVYDPDYSNSEKERDVIEVKAN
ncbi:hypothetical protein SpCBS45565_g07834 [Spizellomyces sp. 'palustris']|nr:hypothetical protein SpCBS45565_g07834 [Spizellomyces sp. 'palustris']